MERMAIIVESKKDLCGTMVESEKVGTKIVVFFMELML